jgi:hypothetical protein
MKKYYCLLVFVIMAFVVSTCAPSEPVEYVHEKAGFKITIPAGWTKMSEDSEMYEFRSGNYKLIEVIGFDLELAQQDIADLTDSEFKNMVRQSALDGLEGYCDEAEIQDYVVEKQRETTWGGYDAYRVKAVGFSNAADKKMVVDLIASFVMRDNRLYAYLYASQISEDVYKDIEDSIETTIASFQIIE